MKKKSLLLLLLLIFTLSCETLLENSDECNMDDCITEEPYTGYLDMRLSIISDNKNIMVLIFRGKYEEQNVQDTLYAQTEDFSHEVPINRYYSVAARYIIDNDTIMVIDGTDLKKSLDLDCEEDCWIVSGGDLDLRLKN